MFHIFILEEEKDIQELFNEIDEVEFVKRYPNDYRRIKDTLDMIEYPMTIVYEPAYVDKVFRDSYYLFYAAKYSKIERNCKRLSFFKGQISEDIFYSKSDENNAKLQEAFVGIMVLKPLKIGRMGRTLLDPTKLKMPSSCLRTTNFDFYITNRHLTIKAFPFSSQDGETMTCAETTVWNIMEYFAHKYPEYKTILASDIIKNLEGVSQERILPSRGLPYDRVSQLLKSFGFSPRKYAVSGWSGELKQAMHYYIESGIPIAVGVKADNGNVYHSIVCIGRSQAHINISEDKYHYIKGIATTDIPLLDSSDLYNEYVLMDDNQAPYRVQKYNSFTIYNEPHVCMFVVPLYKRIFLEAQDAKKIILKILEHPKLSFLKMLSGIDETIDNSNPLIFRLFLTSSRKFKSYRENCEDNRNYVGVYDDALYPKFVWVAEIFTKQSYEEGMAYGEIVVDATAARNSSIEESIVMLRYLSNIGYRLPNELIKDLQVRMAKPTIGYGKKFKMYIDNLLEVGEI